MDATRPRRTRDRARRAWYAHSRQVRFVHFLAELRAGHVPAPTMTRTVARRQCA